MNFSDHCLILTISVCNYKLIADMNLDFNAINKLHKNFLLVTLYVTRVKLPSNICEWRRVAFKMKLNNFNYFSSMEC